MRKILLIIFIICILLTLSGCTDLKQETKESKIDSGFRVLVNYDAAQVLYDKETGVMYWREYHGGFTPILNADGSLRIWEDKNGSH